MNPADQKVHDDEDGVAPVKILDGTGRLIRIVPAAEFRRDHPIPERSRMDKRPRKRASTRTSDTAPDANELAVAS